MGMAMRSLMKVLESISVKEVKLQEDDALDWRNFEGTFPEIAQRFKNEFEQRPEDDEKTIQAMFISDFCHAYGVKSESNTDVEMHALTQKFISKAEEFEHPPKTKWFTK